MQTKILALLVIVVLLALLVSNVHIWEDGSFAFGSFPYSVKGCLPFAICN